MLAISIMIALTTPAQSEPAGTVSLAVGTVRLDRGGQVFRAVPNSALRDGDRLTTESGGGAGLVLDSGHVVYLGPASVAELERDAGGAVLNVVQGEARAAVDGGAFSLASGSVRAQLTQGILRIEHDSRGVRVWSEVGSAEVANGSNRLAGLNAGQELLVPATGEPVGPNPARAEAWSIQVEKLILAGAAASSRSRKPSLAGEANDATAELIGPSGQITTPTDEEPTDQPRSPEPTPEEPTPPEPGTDQESDTNASTTLAQPASTSAISLALGGAAPAGGIGASGGFFSDAQQDSLNTVTPGNVHLVTASTRYVLGDVSLRESDLFPSVREYWSIGVGPSPTSQVVTTFRTGSDLVPRTIRIPRFDAYLVRFPLSNYGVPDATDPSSAGATLGIAGLVGQVPTDPQVRGAVPLRDDRRPTIINDRATFALGEFAVDREGNNPRFDIRRSDQDRRIVKSPDGNDNNDRVERNPDVNFRARPDPRFFPEVPAIIEPVPNNALNNPPRFDRLDALRRAAATALIADRLGGFSQRTGRTRFVLDGRVVDIAGFRPGRVDAVRSGRR